MSDLPFGKLPVSSLRGPDLSEVILSRLDAQQVFLSKRKRAWIKVARITGLGLASAAAIGMAAIQSQRWTAALRDEQARALGPLVQFAAQRASESMARVAEIGTPGESWVIATIPATLPAESPASVQSLVGLPTGATALASGRARLWTWEPAVRAASQIPQSAAASSLVDGYLRRRDRGGAGASASAEWAASPSFRFIRALSVTDSKDPYGAAGVRTVAWPASAAPVENPR